MFKLVALRQCADMVDDLLLASVHVLGRREHHLHHGDEEYGGQDNGARHGGVVGSPEVRQAVIAKRDEGRWKKVNKGCCQQDTSAEMPDPEEEGCWDAESWKLDDQHREGAGAAGHEEDYEESSNMKRCVVLVLAAAASFACRSFGQVHGGVSELCTVMSAQMEALFRMASHR